MKKKKARKGEARKKETAIEKIEKKSEPLLINAIIFALLCVALLAAYLFYTNFLQREVEEKIFTQLGKARECVEGQEKNCSSEKGCAGASVCAGGEWSACIVKRVCVPGTIKVCPIKGGCGYGKQTCNECGTGLSECASP